MNDRVEWLARFNSEAPALCIESDVRGSGRHIVSFIVEDCHRVRDPVVGAESYGVRDQRILDLVIRACVIGKNHILQYPVLDFEKAHLKLDWNDHSKRACQGWVGCQLRCDMQLMGTQESIVICKDCK